MFCYVTCSMYKNTHRPCIDANGSRVQQVWGKEQRRGFWEILVHLCQECLFHSTVSIKIGFSQPDAEESCDLTFWWLEGRLWDLAWRALVVFVQANVCAWLLRSPRVFLADSCWQSMSKHPVSTSGILTLSSTFSPQYWTVKLDLIARQSVLKGTWSFFKLMAVNSRLPFPSAASIRSLFLPFVHPLLLAHPFLIVLMMTDLGVGQATCKVIMGKWTCRTHGPLTSILTLTATASN